MQYSSIIGYFVVLFDEKPRIRAGDIAETKTGP
jgi:hypothetical protein